MDNDASPAIKTASAKTLPGGTFFNEDQPKNPESPQKDAEQRPGRIQVVKVYGSGEERALKVTNLIPKPQ